MNVQRYCHGIYGKVSAEVFVRGRSYPLREGQYLVLLINTKPEDCQEIQKRIDVQFRKKNTVYEIRYNVKSVRSLNNAKDDQSLS